MIRRNFTLALVVGLTAALTGTAVDDKKDPPTKDGAFSDATFVRMAASGGMFEVESSKAAVKQAASPDVKKFAEMMVKDHEKANKELMTAAESLKIKVDPSLTKEHQAMLEKLTTYKGKNFDADYMDAQVAAHEEAVALFTRESKEGKEATLKEWATKTLPSLQDHLKMAKQTQASLKK